MDTSVWAALHPLLGYQPTIPGSLLDSNVNYSHLDPTEAFQHKLECRVRAATAVVKADNDLRLRRALYFDNTEAIRHDFWSDRSASIGARQLEVGPESAGKAQPQRTHRDFPRGGRGSPPA